MLLRWVLAGGLAEQCRACLSWSYFLQSVAGALLYLPGECMVLALVADTLAGMAGDVRGVWREHGGDDAVLSFGRGAVATDGAAGRALVREFIGRRSQTDPPAIA